MTSLKIEFKKILDKINESTHILIVPHSKPDGDAIGSSLAISLVLDNLGKRHKIFCTDPINEYFKFGLPARIEVLTKREQLLPLYLKGP